MSSFTRNACKVICSFLHNRPPTRVTRKTPDKVPVLSLQVTDIFLNQAVSPRQPSECAVIVGQGPGRAILASSVVPGPPRPTAFPARAALALAAFKLALTRWVGADSEHSARVTRESPAPGRREPRPARRASVMASEARLPCQCRRGGPRLRRRGGPTILLELGLGIRVGLAQDPGVSVRVTVSARRPPAIMTHDAPGPRATVTRDNPTAPRPGGPRRPGSIRGLIIIGLAGPTVPGSCQRVTDRPSHRGSAAAAGVPPPARRQ